MNQNEKKKKRKSGSRTFIYIYIYTHHQLTICTYVCRRYCRRTKTNSRPVTLLSLDALVELQSHLISSFSSSSFFFYDTLCCFANDPYQRENACAYKKSVITRFEVDEDASSCCSVRERATSYYRSRVAAAELVRKQDEHYYYPRLL